MRGFDSRDKISVELGNVSGELVGLRLLFQERRQVPKLQGAIRTFLFVLENLLVPLVCFFRVKPDAVLALVGGGGGGDGGLLHVTLEGKRAGESGEFRIECGG